LAATILCSSGAAGVSRNLISPGNGLLARLKKFFGRAANDEPDAFLGRCKGVIHAGANSGQERDVYARHGLRVVWIEPLPAIFDELKANIAPFAEQIAIKALLGSRDNEPQVLRVSNNEGLSSSILDLKYHKEIWPHVDFVGEIEMRSVTLPAALAANNIDACHYDALVMDTQGSELMILEGAADLLEGFTFIKTEAADFESYANCATVESLTRFATGKGFRLVRQDKFAEHPSLGAYYDLLFARN
jgi:FkbM family methyltransferase